MKYAYQETLKGHQAAIYALCEGAIPSEILSGGADQQVILWDLEKLSPQKIIAKSPTTIISLCYIKALNILLIGQVEGGVHVIDLNKGKELKYIKAHKGYIFDILFLADKQEVVFVSGDGTITVWSVPQFDLLYRQTIASGKVRKAVYSSLNREVAFASGDGKVVFLDSLDWSYKGETIQFDSSINSLAYINQDKALLIGEKDAQLHRLDCSSMTTNAKIPAHYWAIYDIQLAPSKKLFATASRDKTVKIWDAKNLTVLKRFEGTKDTAHTHSVNKIIWSGYKNYLLSAGDDKTIKVWKICED